MKNLLITIGVTAFLGYSIVGTGFNIDYIKQEAPKHMQERNWKILRYEGNQWGSWKTNGGKCCYHVCNIDNPSIQYRVEISSWRGELQYWYGAPENLSRLNINVNQ